MHNSMTHLKWGVLAFDYLIWSGATAEFVKDRGVMFFSSQVHQRHSAGE